MKAGVFEDHIFKNGYFKLTMAMPLLNNKSFSLKANIIENCGENRINCTPG